MTKEHGSTWATTLKKLRQARFDPISTRQWNLHYPVDHKEFSHLLTSINWWSSQKEKTTHRDHTTCKMGKLE